MDYILSENFAANNLTSILYTLYNIKDLEDGIFMELFNEGTSRNIGRQRDVDKPRNLAKSVMTE